LSYDNYGNIHRVTDPLGYTQEYNYEGIAHTYVTQVDSYNQANPALRYTSLMEWDLGLGVQTASVDMNGNRIEYEFDSFGRMVGVFSPYDRADGVPAVEYEYHTDSFPWYAISRNKVSFDADECTTRTSSPTGKI